MCMSSSIILLLFLVKDANGVRLTTVFIVIINVISFLSYGTASQLLAVR